MRELYSEIKKNKPVKAADIVFLAVLFVVLIVLFFVLPFKSGSSAEIYCDGKLVRVMPLDTDAQYTYYYGEQEFNVIVVKDGKIYVEDSNCKDKICQNFAPSDKVGSTVICLPHRLFIIIKGEDGVDGVL